MLGSTIKKIIICLSIVLIAIILFNNVHAWINEDYYNSNKVSMKVMDTAEALNKKISSSVVLEAIGILIYALASLGEWLLGLIFFALSAGLGGADAQIFPWADAILFNAVPFLDINFLNPYNSGTIVGLIQGVIRSMYGTVFGLAISFFSIAVLIMGVKLAISTIASEKAKYKQAIWDWLVGLILLFTMHLFISFVFYLNEELVKVASDDIAAEALKEASNMVDVNVPIDEMERTLLSFMTSQYSYDMLDAICHPVDAVGQTISNIVNLGNQDLLDNVETVLEDEYSIKAAYYILDDSGFRDKYKLRKLDDGEDDEFTLEFADIKFIKFDKDHPDPDVVDELAFLTAHMSEVFRCIEDFDEDPMDYIDYKHDLIIDPLGDQMRN